MHSHIFVKGARANNLKNIDVHHPPGQAGGAHRPVRLAASPPWPSTPSMPRDSGGMWSPCPPTPGCSWARWRSPTWTTSTGLSPAISIDQKTTSKNPRSTVGTVTEIYDYLRLLWARVGTPHCPICGKEIKQQTIDQIIDQVLALPEATRIQVMAPVIRGKKGEHAKVFEDARTLRLRPRAGWTASPTICSEEIKLEKNKKHNIEIVVDRLVIRDGHRPPAHRLAWRRPPTWRAAW